MIHSSSIEINKSALKQNIKFIKKYVGKNVKFSSVVKGNAYGHGIEKFVPIAEDCGADHFSVFSADEAARVKKVCNKKTEIMIMGNIDNEDLQWAIENNIQFYVFEMTRLEAALASAKKIKKSARMHLELETGMYRTGFENLELKKALKLLKGNPRKLYLEGVCTHFAGAESISNYLRVQNQFKKFNRLKRDLEKSGIRPKRYHTACSAATITYPKTHMDMVRIGILHYGFWPTRETYIQYISKNKIQEQPLKRVISWKSKVMDVKKVKTGEFVGYGTTYLAQKDMKIATIPIGYSHGFARGLSNIGRVLVNGQRAGVIGMVNMNLMTIDVSDFEGVKKGDEVVLIGKQGELEVSVSSFSELSSQVNYETLARLPESIPRTIID